MKISWLFAPYSSSPNALMFVIRLQMCILPHLGSTYFLCASHCTGAAEWEMNKILCWKSLKPSGRQHVNRSCYKSSKCYTISKNRVMVTQRRDPCSPWEELRKFSGEDDPWAESWRTRGSQSDEEVGRDQCKQRRSGSNWEILRIPQVAGFRWSLN